MWPPVSESSLCPRSDRAFILPIWPLTEKLTYWISKFLQQHWSFIHVGRIGEKRLRGGIKPGFNQSRSSTAVCAKRLPPTQMFETDLPGLFSWPSIWKSSFSVCFGSCTAVSSSREWTRAGFSQGFFSLFHLLCHFKAYVQEWVSTDCDYSAFICKCP